MDSQIIVGPHEIRAKKAREAAARRTYTLAEAARFLGVSARTLREWERNPQRMSIENARRYADYLGCSVEELFYLPGDGN